MKRKLTALLLSLALCVGLSVPALAAEEQKIVVNDGEVYAHVLRALLSCTEDEPVTLRLESDIQLTATVILGASDYDGLFGGEVITVIPHDITIDLNGYTLTGEAGVAVFEVQEGYTLTIVDTSADKTGKLVTQGEDAVTVAEGGTYIPLSSPEEEQKIVANDSEVYAHVLQALLSCTEDEPVTLRLESDIQLTATVILGASDYDGLFGGAVITVIPHDITIDLNGYTLTGEEGVAVFEVQEGYTLTIADTSEGKTGKLVSQGDETVAVAQGGVYNPLKEPAQPDEQVHTGGVSKPAINPNAGKDKEKVTFTDVAEDAWYADAVSWAVAQGITSGASETTFSPDAFCTRGQVVTFLWRAMGKPKADGDENPFSDVGADDYCYDAVLWAYTQGITTGVSDTLLGVDAPCTRAQVVTFLHRAQGMPECETKCAFADVEAGAWYADAVSWAVAQGITSGTGETTFSPDAVCTRAQTVTFLSRI